MDFAIVTKPVGAHGVHPDARGRTLCAPTDCGMTRIVADALIRLGGVSGLIIYSIMKTLFDAADREALVERIHALQPGAQRQWGKMNPAQMLCHCTRPLESATGDRPVKQRFLGKLVTPLIRSSIFSEKPFSKNSPTDPTFVVADERDFAEERAKLLMLIDRLVARGPAATGNAPHSFFGKLSGEEWGQLMYKHIDHHLQQFGV